MIDHLSTYATDYAASKAFYDAVLGSLGYSVQMEMVTSWDPEFPERRMCAYGEGRPVFWVVEVKETATPRHVAFTAPDQEAVKAFYQAGLGAGGSDNGEPGPRPQYHPNYFGGFLLDPDGNNVEAVCHS